MRYDLHVHTHYSDGLHSPKKVIDKARSLGLRGIAITDHDSVMGIEEALSYSKEFEDFELIPGIELSCIYRDDEVHILGYFIDYKEEKLHNTTQDLRKHRKIRGKRMVEKLNTFGIAIDFHKIKSDNPNDFVGRVAIARELISKGYANNIQDAFNKYLNPGRPAFVERYKLAVEDVIKLIKGAGGLAVLAHPGLLKDETSIDYSIIKGIDGIEAIHSKHTPKEVKAFKEIARRNNLIATGGSDCHGEYHNGDILLGKYYTDLDTIKIMKERIK